jgi:hypothetical protein
MKQLVAIAFVLVFLSVPAMSQAPAQQSGDSKCTAKFAQTLSIRGVHLGMSSEELFTLFPDARNQPFNQEALEKAKVPPQFGRASITIYSGGKVRNEKLAGINQIGVELFDNRIVSYLVSYEGPPTGAQWDSVDQWIVKLSETLNLPVISEWVPRDNSKIVNCEGIQILANVNTNGMIRVIKDDWVPQSRAREKAYEEQKRREFKP